ncbi:MAG: hypothetical protein JHC60_09735 [Sphingobium sp.]|nr:hypothetical protein [Sphingobium sp.]
MTERLSESPAVALLERGFHHACEDLRPARRFVIYPGTEIYPMSSDIAVMPLQAAGEDLLARH